MERPKESNIVHCSKPGAKNPPRNWSGKTLLIVITLSSGLADTAFVLATTDHTNGWNTGTRTRRRHPVLAVLLSCP
jgi:hypothetical protein